MCFQISSRSLSKPVFHFYFRQFMEYAHQMDAIDRRIITELQRDATLSHAELAQRVGSSPASVWRRIKALESAGILLGSVRLVDADRLGQCVNIFCEVRLRDYSTDCVAAFEQLVEDESKIIECFSISGDWDYLMRVVAADVSDYERFLVRILLKHRSVRSASSHFALSVTKYKTALPVPD